MVSSSPETAEYVIIIFIRPTSLKIASPFFPPLYQTKTIAIDINDIDIID